MMTPEERAEIQQAHQELASMILGMLLLLVDKEIFSSDEFNRFRVRATALLDQALAKATT